MRQLARPLLWIVLVLAAFPQIVQARIYDPSTGRWIQRDPAGYVGGTNTYGYVGSSPVSWVDPLGLEAARAEGCNDGVDCSNTAGLNDCEKAYCRIAFSLPALEDGGRLANARDASGIDSLATMYTLAWKESSFNPSAKNPNSSASGMFQILDGTKSDIENRVWPRFVGGNGFPPYPATDPNTGASINDWRYDPGLATTAAYAYLLDRIASRGGSLENGIGAYGEGSRYAKQAMKGIAALKNLCGVPPGTEMTVGQLGKCASEKCDAIKRTLDSSVRGDP